MNDPRLPGTSRNPVTDHLELWTSALLAKSTAGRAGNGRLEAFGIKKLRQLILELAMCGKLLPRLSDVESATLLREKIEKEKARLVKLGVLNKEKPLPEITDAEKICELPQEWVWVRFGSIARHNSGKTLDRGRNAGELRDYITTSNLYWGRFDLSNVRQMPIADDELERCTARRGDLLICEGGESGRAAVWDYDKEVCFQNHVHRARFFCDIDPYFIYRFFEKLNATGEIDQHRKGVGISNMSSKALASIVVPLPPLSEQHRIVAKVDELMALCDQLEQQQARGIEAHQTLVETLLGTLTSVESAQEFAAAWNRIAEHFDTLFTTEHSVDQLKQTILQLAVMGKLVPQDSKDEPASMLLENVARTKGQKRREGRAKKDSPLPEVCGQDMPFSLPISWTWARFGWLVNFSSELVRPEDFPDLDQVAPDSIEKGTGKLLFRRTVSESGVRGPNNRFYAGQILYSKIRPSLSKAIIAEFDGLCSADMYPIDSMIDSGYLLRVILSEPFLEQVRVAENRIKMPKLNVESLSCMVVPVPPLYEQRRIVAKVDELMALCDALKACLAEAQTTQVRLADAIVEQAVAASETATA